MDALELLKVMGFEYKQSKYVADIEGQDTICTYHMITHPLVRGLILGHPTLEGAMKHCVPAMKTLLLANELKVRKQND